MYSVGCSRWDADLEMPGRLGPTGHISNNCTLWQKGGNHHQAVERHALADTAIDGHMAAMNGNSMCNGLLSAS